MRPRTSFTSGGRTYIKTGTRCASYKGTTHAELAELRDEFRARARRYARSAHDLDAYISGQTTSDPNALRP